MNETNENIVIFFHEDNYISEEIKNNINEIISEETENSVEQLYPQILHYQLNYTVKQLLLICEYYGIHKAKTNKKDNLIRKIIAYESNPKHLDNVYKRKNLWFYINELKNDKFMKKFILCDI